MCALRTTEWSTTPARGYRPPTGRRSVFDPLKKTHEPFDPGDRRTVPQCRLSKTVTFDINAAAHPGFDALTSPTADRR
jgi:hypothetical protein